MEVLVSFFKFQKLSFGFQHHLAIDRVGQGGGITMMWRNKLISISCIFPSNFIHGSITDSVVSTQKWYFTGVYGYPKVEKHLDTCANIRSLCQDSVKAQLVFEDFTEILRPKEKWGGKLRSDKQMENFCNVLSYCALRDLGFCGPPFIWCSRREGDLKNL